MIRTSHVGCGSAIGLQLGCSARLLADRSPILRYRAAPAVVECSPPTKPRARRAGRIRAPGSRSRARSLSPARGPTDAVERPRRAGADQGRACAPDLRRVMPTIRWKDLPPAPLPPFRPAAREEDQGGGSVRAQALARIRAGCA